MSLLVFTLIIWIPILLLLVVLSMVWPPDSPWAPWWKTTSSVAQDMGRLAKLTKNDVIYELGSGDGEALVTLAREYHIKAVGIEIDPFRYLQAKLRVWRSGVGGNVTFYRKNFHAIDLSPATVVYFYLVPRAIKKLTPKLRRELHPGTRVISYRYKIEDLPQIGFDKKNLLYLYEIPKQGRGEGKRVQSSKLKVKTIKK